MSGLKWYIVYNTYTSSATLHHVINVEVRARCLWATVNNIITERPTCPDRRLNISRHQTVPCYSFLCRDDLGVKSFLVRSPARVVVLSVLGIVAASDILLFAPDDTPLASALMGASRLVVAVSDNLPADFISCYTYPFLRHKRKRVHYER